MRPALFVSAVLALGTALTFGAAAIAATMMPGTTVVPVSGGFVRVNDSMVAPAPGGVWRGTIGAPDVVVTVPEPTTSG